jgi:hypothetical protein
MKCSLTERKVEPRALEAIFTCGSMPENPKTDESFTDVIDFLFNPNY